MKMKKIDLSGVKVFLFEKGERLGMAVCGVIALVLLAFGIMKATGTSTPYAENLKNITKGRSSKLVAGGEVDGTQTAAVPKVGDEWPMREVNFEPTPLIQAGDAPDNKRRNPVVLKTLDDDKHIQVDFLRGGYFSYELDRDKVVTFGGDKVAAGPAGANATGPRMVKIMKPARFVVVSAVFPMRDQLEEYRRKLNLASVAELLARPDDMPQPVGLNVYRCELKPNRKPNDPVDWTPLYKYDPKEDRVEAAERLDKLYREAYIDEENPKVLVNYIQHGLTTPLPLLANIQYPKLNLQEIKPLEDAPDDPKQPARVLPNQFKRPPMVVMPGMQKQPNPAADPGGNDQDVKFVDVAWKKLPQRELAEKFSGKIDFFDPLGVFPDKDPANPGSGVQAPTAPKLMQRPFGPGGNAPPAAGDKLELFDALVRFVDVGVEPGKTYQYLFQVRMANPNYKKHKDVAFQALAEVKEILSPVSYSPEVTIPGEYFAYAIDKAPDIFIPGGSDGKQAKADATVPFGNWTTTMQIHKWVGKLTEGVTDWTVADWAIAERLLLRRGDVVGRYHVMTQVPVWNKAREEFEIGFEAQKVDAKKKQARAGTGLPLNFIEEPPPVLIDFEGGWKTQVKVGSTTIPRDEAAVEVLILSPDGKMTVRNSRRDSDAADPNNTVAVDRQERYERWLTRIRQLRNGGGTAAPGGPAMPNGRGS